MVLPLAAFSCSAVPVHHSHSPGQGGCQPPVPSRQSPGRTVKPGAGPPLMLALRTLLKRITDCGPSTRRASAKAFIDTMSPFLLRTKMP